MRILVTGANGYVGARVIQSLKERGHQPVGLVRSTLAAERLRTDNVEAVLGDFADPSSFIPTALASDGVINTAFGHTIDFMEAVEQERQAVGALVEAFAGTGKRLVSSTATGVIGDTGPLPVEEDFPGQPGFPARVRMAVEEHLRRAVSRDIDTVVVRPAIFVHGHGASQFVPMLVDIARRTGKAGYIAEGSNRIASVHVDDLAQLFVLAAERGAAGAVYNGSGGDVSTAELAAAIAAGNPGVEAVSYSPERASEVWGQFPAMLLAINNRASGARAVRELGWAPYATNPRLVDDVANGSYAVSAGPTG